MTYTFLPNRGFTLMEILIVLGLTTTMAGLTAAASFSEYGHALTLTDADAVERALRRARGEAQAGVCRIEPCDTPAQHAVFLEGNVLSLKEGTAGVIASFTLNGSEAMSPIEWLFMRGSGDAIVPGYADLSGVSGEWRISVSEAGMIESHHLEQ